MPTRPPGVYDRPPAEAAYAAALSAELARVLNSFGYQTVETPLIEYADLFLTKSGDDAINRLFVFELYGRQLCLRSEFTVSAARLYVERFQHEPKPIRWQFGGPVFRYETPGRGHSRQFTMIGAELIGPSGVAGDAETLGMAARGLFALGLRDWTLVIGHVGLVSALLDRFDLDRRTRRFMLGQIENLRRADRGRAYVEAQFEQMYAMLPKQLERLEASPSLAAHEDVAQALQLLLQSANLGTTGGNAGTGRTNEDVARRLLIKQQRANQRGQVSAALDLLERFTAIEGTPAASFAAIEALLPDDLAVREMARSFRATVDLLAAYGVAPEQISIQMGLARGLNYYTGIVFEIYTNGGSDQGDPFQHEPSQLCGGGRYDDFIRVIGAAQDTPAVGLAFGIERIVEEAHRVGIAEPRQGARALVVPIGDADNLAAAELANQLRDHWPTELYTPPARNLSQALTYADRQQIPYVFLIGEAERAAESVTLRRMGEGVQVLYQRSELAALIAELEAAS